MSRSARERPTLLVASTGGHLAELHALWRRLAPTVGAVEWATFDTEQSRALLAGETVHYIPFVYPKDHRGVIRNVKVAHRLLRERHIARVISTGAGVAVPYFVTARELGLPAHYIESAARTQRPSLTGAMLARIPGVRLYSQHDWKSARWDFNGSVFDAFAAQPRPVSTQVDKIVVIFGTQRDFGFRRAAEKLAALVPEISTSSADVLWQTGGTDISRLGIAGVEHVPLQDLDQAVDEADLVISHAGVGTALLALAKGQVPVLLPRMRQHREHTDNHQRQVASALHGRGLAFHVEVDELVADDLVRATGRTAMTVQASDFQLQPETSRRAAKVHANS